MILEEKELPQAGGARGVGEKGSDNRTGPHGHSGFSSRYRVLWQGSNGVASEGSCRNVDRLRGHRIWWLLFLKELRGKVIASVRRECGRGGEQEQGPFGAVLPTRSLLATAQRWNTSIVPVCPVGQCWSRAAVLPGPSLASSVSWLEMQIHRLYPAYGIRIWGDGAQQTALTGFPTDSYRKLLKFENLCLGKDGVSEAGKDPPSRGKSPGKQAVCRSQLYKGLP